MKIKVKRDKLIKKKGALLPSERNSPDNSIQDTRTSSVDDTLIRIIAKQNAEQKGTHKECEN